MISKGNLVAEKPTQGFSFGFRIAHHVGIHNDEYFGTLSLHADALQPITSLCTLRSHRHDDNGDRFGRKVIVLDKAIAPVDKKHLRLKRLGYS